MRNSQRNSTNNSAFLSVTGVPGGSITGPVPDYDDRYYGMAVRLVQDAQ